MLKHKKGSLIHRATENIERDQLQAMNIADTVGEAFGESVNLCIEKGKEPPAIEVWLKNPKKSVEEALTYGVEVNGIKLSTSKVLELMDVSLNFLNPLDGIKANQSFHYDKLIAVNGKLEYDDGFLEIEIPEKHSIRCETNEEEYLLNLLKKLEDAAYNIAKSVPGFTQYWGGFSELTGGMLVSRVLQKDVIINIEKFKKLSRMVELEKKMEAA
jgi:hypothetical protein